MSKQKAFPVNKPNGDPELYNGMDLRDYFAAHAKHNDIKPYIGEVKDEVNEGKDFSDHVHESTSPEIICHARYRYADDMMEARND